MAIKNAPLPRRPAALQAAASAVKKIGQPKMPIVPKKPTIKPIMPKKPLLPAMGKLAKRAPRMMRKGRVYSPKMK